MADTHNLGEPMPPQAGVQRSRYGEEIASGYKVLRKAIVADEIAPTTYLQCVTPSKYPRVRWVVNLPALVTGCTLVVGRWVRVNIGGTQTDMFIEDGDHPIDQNARQVVQETNGDHVWAYVRDIVGTVGSGIAIVWKAVGPGPV